MTDSNTSSTSGTDEVLGADAGNTTEKDPKDWVHRRRAHDRGAEELPDTLARDAARLCPPILTKAEASAEIERLQGETDRG